MTEPERDYQLVVRKGPEPGHVFPLLASAISIGRDPTSDISLTDPEVSRYHAQLVKVEEGYQIQDMGSTNGTYIDGKRLGSDPVLLAHGQSIQLGSNVVVEYQLAETEESAAETVVDSRLQPEWEDAEADEPAPKMLEAGEGLSMPELDDPYKLPRKPSPPPARPAPAPSYSQPLVPPADGGKDTRRRNTMIAVIVLLLVCCCCLFLVSAYFFWGDLLLEWLEQQGVFIAF